MIVTEHFRWWPFANVNTLLHAPMHSWMPAHIKYESEHLPKVCSFKLHMKRANRLSVVQHV